MKNHISKKLKILFAFYKSNAEINVSFFVIACFFAPESMILVMSVFANISVLLFQKFYRKHELYFYFNNQISEVQLFGFCFLLNVLVSILFCGFYFFVLNFFEF